MQRSLLRDEVQPRDGSDSTGSGGARDRLAEPRPLGRHAVRGPNRLTPHSLGRTRLRRVGPGAAGHGARACRGDAWPSRRRRRVRVDRQPRRGRPAVAWWTTCGCRAFGFALNRHRTLVGVGVPRQPASGAQQPDADQRPVTVQREPEGPTGPQVVHQPGDHRGDLGAADGRREPDGAAGLGDPVPERHHGDAERAVRCPGAARADPAQGDLVRPGDAESGDSGPRARAATPWAEVRSQVGEPQPDLAHRGFGRIRSVHEVGLGLEPEVAHGCCRWLPSPPDRYRRRVAGMR